MHFKLVSGQSVTSFLHLVVWSNDGLTSLQLHIYYTFGQGHHLLLSSRLCLPSGVTILG